MRPGRILFELSFPSEEQAKIAKDAITDLEAAGVYPDPVVTEISPATVFYKAEDYHQNYYNLNGNAPYCTFVIRPKLEKFRKAFDDVLIKN